MRQELEGLVQHPNNNFRIIIQNNAKQLLRKLVFLSPFGNDRSESFLGKRCHSS